MTDVIDSAGRKAARAQWRPMKTAPKDGTTIFILMPDESLEAVYWADKSIPFAGEFPWKMAFRPGHALAERIPTSWKPYPRPTAKLW